MFVIGLLMGWRLSDMRRSWPTSPCWLWSTDPKPPIRLRHISAPLHRLRDVIKIDELGRDIFGIVVPAVLALVADPITSLVDTAFVGHLSNCTIDTIQKNGFSHFVGGYSIRRPFGVGGNVNVVKNSGGSVQDHGVNVPPSPGVMISSSDDKRAQ